MLRFAYRNLVNRPVRNGFALFGLAMAVAVLASIAAFGAGYKRALGSEIDRMGVQLMLVPLGCPYDAAARVLKGKQLDNSLPEAAWLQARNDPAVAVAAPLFMAVVPRPDEGRSDMWVGLDESALKIKPWWQPHFGGGWFTRTNSVILGVDAAELEMRSPGDKFYSPEAGQDLEVAGVLERSGTSDDSLFFVPLATAQHMFAQPGRLTAIAIRLRTPERLPEACERLQKIPGAQVVTLTEMMGSFLNLLGAVRTLMIALTILAVCVSALSVFNTLMAAVVERANELSILRALGASRRQLLGLIGMEAFLLASTGSAGGVLLSLGLGPALENLLKSFVPLAPTESLVCPSIGISAGSAALGIASGLLACLYPAWRASRTPPAEALKLD